MNALAVASATIHLAMASYDTGSQEFSAPSQCADATGYSSAPRELVPARTKVQRRDENAPRPSASATACCSVAPRPIFPGSHEKKRSAPLAGFPGSDARSVLMMTIRSTPALVIAASTVAMFVERRADGSPLVDVTPIAVRTASAPESASTRAPLSAREVTRATREPGGTSTIRSGRERTMAVNAMRSVRHTLSMLCPRPPAAPMTAM